MAQIKNGMIKGVVGTEIFGKVELHVKQGMQQMRSASSKVTNTRTAAQMYQRLKMYSSAPLWYYFARGWPGRSKKKLPGSRKTLLIIRTLQKIMLPSGIQLLCMSLFFCNFAVDFLILCKRKNSSANNRNNSAK